MVPRRQCRNNPPQFLSLLRRLDEDDDDDDDDEDDDEDDDDDDDDDDDEDEDDVTDSACFGLARPNFTCLSTRIAVVRLTSQRSSTTARSDIEDE
ncbi:hypothetical protein M0802_000450 [Mischocyttarus mexicanus]|nr:hypothetical protein M0802_000450 [Mischocyttarus mexicanus]